MPDEKKHIPSESDAFEAWMAQALGEYNEPGTGFGRSMMRNAFGAGAAWHAYENPPPPSRAGEEGVEALAQDALDAIIHLQGGWEPGTKDSDGLTPLDHITRALESERERAARKCEEQLPTQIPFAFGSMAEGIRQATTKAVQRCAVAVRAGKGA